MLGSPSEETWQGISQCEDLVKYNFPQYPSEPLVKRAPRLDQDGIDLVSKFLLYEAKSRISARAAMKHAYFESLGTGVQELGDGEFITKQVFYFLKPQRISTSFSVVCLFINKMKTICPSF